MLILLVSYLLGCLSLDPGGIVMPSSREHSLALAISQPLAREFSIYRRQVGAK